MSAVNGFNVLYTAKLSYLKAYSYHTAQTTKFEPVQKRQQ